MSADKPSRSDQLPDDYALVFRDNKVVLVPRCEASPAELETGVRSVESLVQRVVKDFLHNTHGTLQYDDRQDLICELVGVAWRESQSYRVGIGTLRGFLYSRLKLRSIDWMRRTFGDERPRQKQLAKEGKSAAEIREIISAERIVLSLDVEDDDVQRYANGDERAALWEQGIEARRLLGELAADDEVTYEIETVEDAERVLGFTASALTPDALEALIDFAMPVARHDSLILISERTGRNRRYIEVGLELLKAEIEAQR